MLVATLCLLLPCITVAAVSYASARSSLIEAHLTASSELAAQQSATLTDYFSDILADAERFKNDDKVIEFAASGKSDDPSEYIAGQLRTLKDYSSGMSKALIFMPDGVITASTVSSDIGNIQSNYENLIENAVSGNGVSDFTMLTGDNETQEPTFSVTRRIFNEESLVVGYLFEVFYTEYIEGSMSGSAADMYTTVAVADSAGNIFTAPFKTVAGFTELSPYSAYSSDITKALEAAESKASSKTYAPPVISSGEKRQAFIASFISNSGWSYIYMVNYTGLTDLVNDNVNEIGITVFLLILSIGGLLAAVIYFLKPITVFSRILEKKASGDSVSRIAFTDRKDEFDHFRDSLNDMFDKLAESNLRYETMVEMTNNIVFTIDLKRKTVETSKNFNKKFAFRPKDDTLEESFIYRIRIHKDDKEKYVGDMDSILKEANFIEGEYRVRNLYGDFAWVMLKATKFFDRSENPSKVIGVIVDIDKEKKSKMTLLIRASYDALTQILNRETFLKTLADTIDSTHMRKDLSAVLFIDLDDFKHFNDDYGHACGDEVLKFTADTLKEITFERGFAGRFGGDEFVACLTGLTLYSNAGTIAQEVIDVMGKGFTSESSNEHFTVHCSIGIAFLHESGKNAEEVIAAADAAMYNIKKHGKSAFAYAQKGDVVEVLSPKPIDSTI
jgi:diguanylate cyclase (GGDEF)-like protein/PAS domain S-box-containing protein